MAVLNVWFPDWYTEAHRTLSKQEGLIRCLRKCGIIAHRNLNDQCKAVFCGTIWQSELVIDTLTNLKLNIPVVQYCWDLYPWQVDGESPDRWKGYLWKPYVEHLKVCAGIIVPSNCTAVRVKQYTGREDCVRVLSPIHLWPTDDLHPRKDIYVVDVMRKYPDPSRHWVKESCDELGIKCVETCATLPWDEFRQLIYGASLLVSAYHEASTGGLTLLEGYARGVPVLLSNSPYMGGWDYFGERATYFYYLEREVLKSQIKDILSNYSPLNLANIEEQRKWVEETYSEMNFARGVADVLKRIATT